jgi:quercetin dioxygenase-like cupin family protein
MKASTSLLKAFLLVGALTCSVLAPAKTDEQGFVIVQNNELDWGPDLSKIKTIPLQGDPNAEGFYIIRIRFPPGNNSRPHFHNHDRFVTVIEGTWWVGRDASGDMTKTVPIKAGGYMKHPAGAVHFDGAREEAAIVEIRGMGPVTTTPATATGARPPTASN